MRPRRDLTQAPIGPALLMFALPTLGSSMLQSANGSIDAVWVGRLWARTRWPRRRTAT